MRLSEQQIEAIRNSADIANVIGHYIPLIKKGRGMVATCPFHDDHSPSLSISEDKQIYKCFVCGNGGNVFTFVSNYEHCSFVEAVIKVAELVNYPLDLKLQDVQTVINPRFTTLYKILDESIQFTKYQLHTQIAQSVRTYLSDRGMDDAILEQFEIGYNPGDNALYKFLNAKGYEDSDLNSCNIARLSTQGMMDVFEGRVTFPIHDSLGHPIGFSARSLQQNPTAKYINTMETDIYVKGKTVYNYHRAKAHCKKLQKVILVEGVTDVIAFARAKIYNVVCTLGTACTKDQLQLIKQLSLNLLFAYDGDKAGQNATYKASKQALELGMSVSVMDNKTGLDPDEIIAKYSLAELVSMAEKEKSWPEFLFEYYASQYDLSNYSEKKEYALKMQSEISNLKDNFDRKNFTHRLSLETGFALEQLEVPTLINPVVNSSRRNTGKIGINAPRPGKTNAEYLILSQMLTSMAAANQFKNELGFLLSETSQQLAMLILDYYRTHTECKIADFLDFLPDEKMKKLVIDLTEWEANPKDNNVEAMSGAIQRMKACLVDEKILELKNNLRLVSNKESQGAIMNELAILIRQRKEYNEEEKV